VPEAADVRFVSGSPADSFDRIRASADGKDLWIVGGGGLASQFAEAGLLDEVWVQLAPVTLGAGPAVHERAAARSARGRAQP